MTDDRQPDGNPIPSRRRSLSIDRPYAYRKSKETYESPIRPFEPSLEQPTPRRRSVIYHSDHYVSDAEDLEFERIFDENLTKYADAAYYAKVAGGKHKNDDGTSRAAAIRRCKFFDQLEFEHEPTNPFDQNAIKIIHKKTGAQLGYVDARQAAEMVRSAKKGKRYSGIFRRATRHPDTNRIVGAIYLLVELKPDQENIQ